jgi:hypothetical protein
VPLRPAEALGGACVHMQLKSQSAAAAASGVQMGWTPEAARRRGGKKGFESRSKKGGGISKLAKKEI